MYVCVYTGMDKRALLLCYPDDFENSQDSMALEALQAYAGDTLIHVGELFGDAVKTTGNGCWGRTTSQEFQEALAEGWHCVLKAELPRWPISGDCISVWRRHGGRCIQYGGSDDGSDDSGSGGGSGGGSGSSGGGQHEDNAAPGGSATPRSPTSNGGRKRKRQAGSDEATAPVAAMAAAADASSGAGGAGADDRSGNEGGGSDSNSSGGSSDDDQQSLSDAIADGPEQDWYACIPPEERLCTDTAVPSFKHLLDR
ncbi:hypothetical protein JKP88DRAFT_233365 [Tribonema minus]|uniref:Uncharacterized protein n=1 Tax=Tribonema minus TaxID=303371 RepID=A0A835ZBY6_9STRA|nr:hypothetical protein JKP88DRAFT_233365 [Tribonema minus]